MQLKIGILVFAAWSLFSVQKGNGQDQSTAQNIEIDFLGSYYEQDGNHSAVTGGKGTEKLDDVTPMIIVNIPFDGNKRVSISGGMDVYTSASSDNVNPVVSGASGSDTRWHLNLGYSVNNPDNNTTLGFSVGGSTEYDYNSFWLGTSWSKLSGDGNRELAVDGQVFFDRVDIIYPIELRTGEEWLSNDKRRTYNLSATYSQVLTKKAQASVMVDAVYQSGLLSTSFNRVFFQDEDDAKVEQLPDHRFKLPIGFRFNYYLNDLITTRFYYRNYHDGFGITANTIEVEIPLRVSQAIGLSPFYRFHKQSAADYFAAFEEHQPGEKYFTSDYDLSPFNSHKYGIGFRYYPLWGIARVSPPLIGKAINVKQTDLRLARYDRSDGLVAYTISLGISLFLN